MKRKERGDDSTVVSTLPYSRVKRAVLGGPVNPLVASTLSQARSVKGD